MRIAITAEGTRGDIHPMLALAASLRDRGHDVVLCVPPDFREAAAEHGLRFHPVGREIRVYLEQEAEALHGGTLRLMGAAERLFHENVASQFADLAEGAQGAALVLAAGTQLSAHSVAEAIGAEYRYIAYDPSVLRSAEQPPFMFRPGRRRLLNRAAWALQIAVVQLRLRPVVDRERAKLGLPPVGDLYPRMLGVRPVLAAEEILAPAPLDAGEVQTVGCLHTFREAPLPEKLLQFLAAGEPPVFVGFGSMTDPDPERTTRLVLKAVRNAGVRAIVSEGWAGLGRSPLPEDVMAIGPVPHASLFQRVAAVVHHGGAGTTTTAARAGVPQILIPHVLDQFHWAHRIEQRGLGPPAIARRHLGVDNLAAALRAIGDNEILFERASEVGRRLRDAASNRPHAADVIA